MASFLATIDGLVNALKTDAALSAFCSTNFAGRSLIISKTFKKRVEISSNDLPTIILTRPSVTKTFLNNNVLHSLHTVLLYAGFWKKDYRATFDLVTQFEEAIEDALWRVAPESIGAMSIVPKNSVNDEGMFAPIYFLTMEVEIQHRRIKA